MANSSAMTPAEKACLDYIMSKAPASIKDGGKDRARKFITFYRKTKLSGPATVQKLATHADRFWNTAQAIANSKTRGTALQTLAAVALWCSLPNAIYKRFSEASTAVNQANVAAAGAQTTSAVQGVRWVPLAELKDHFETVLKPAYEDVKESGILHKRTVQLYVAAFLNLYEPPIRGVYADVVMLLSPPESDELVQGADNLIYLPPSGNARLYINNDKVSSTSIRQGNLGVDAWDLQPGTTAMLRDTLTVWDRSYVMADNPISPDTYSKLVGDALTVDGKRVGLQLIRTIWVTEFFLGSSTPGGPLDAERKELARKMRHSIGTQSAAYRKNVLYPVKPASPVAGMQGFTGAPAPAPAPASAATGGSAPGNAPAAPVCTTAACSTQVETLKDTAAARRFRRYNLNHADARRAAAKQSYNQNSYTKLQKALLKRLQTCPGVKVTQASIDKYHLVCRPDGKWVVQ